MNRRIIPDVITGQQELCCLRPEVSAREAAQVMVERHIAAVMVVAEGRLKGIVTERDLVYKLLAARADPDGTTLGEIMTPDPDTVTPNERARDALLKMHEGHYRHLPVVEDSTIRGMVSVRDLYRSIHSELEEDLRHAEEFIHGESYGVAGG